MKNAILTLVLIMIAGNFMLSSGEEKKLPSNELWYNQPAGQWTEALPVGNGRLGAMIFGNPLQEHLQFNEETLWDCYPREYQRDSAFTCLPQIRNLLFEGKQAEAEKVAGEHFMGRRAWEDNYPEVEEKNNPPFPSQYQADYQPFGDLLIDFPGHNQYSGYRRSLDISRALAHVSYLVNGSRFTREYFSSHPGELIAMKFSADRKGLITFTAKLSSPHQFHSVRKVDGNTIALSLKIADGVLKGEAWLRVETKKGTVKIDENGIQVANADEAVLKLVAATSFVSYKDISGDPENRCRKYIDSSAGLPYETLLKQHLRDYQPQFNRVSIDLGGANKRELPVNERIINIKKAPDNDLAALYVQYSRYLLLSSAREGTMPPNLQGIWNDQMKPPWGSKYTTNINTEMNMWGAEVLNLAECHQTLFKLIKEVAAEGQKSARAYYNARGWVLHHNTDLWRGTAPINASNHGIWVTGGAWLCHHLWEHYLYSLDKEFLREQAWPLIRESARFFLDYLVLDPKSGYLISSPSNSPETGGLVAGPTMDHEIIRSLFKIAIQCTGILETDKEFANEVRQKLDLLAPYKIGRYGQLQEWLEDKDDTTNKHRHVSHLWAVYPGSEITADANPELMKAARQSLLYRGDAATGWSLAWKINFWARFREGDHAHKMVQMLLAPANDPARDTRGGSYPNLLDAHPPFQIDGNFGGAAGITEMLVQSHQGYIELLPALPEEWQKGKISGLRTRGGFSLDMVWNNGKVTLVKVTSLAGQPLRMKVNGKMIEKNIPPGKSFILKPV